MANGKSDIRACGGGGFLGCANPGTERVEVAGGGLLGYLCNPCAEFLESQIQRRMRDNWTRYEDRLTAATED